MLSKTKVKYIQSLSHKKLRDELHLFVAEGPKVVEELLRSRKFNCEILCAVKGWLEQQDSTVTGNIGEFNEIEMYELEKISSLSNPHTVLGVFSQKEAMEISLKNKISLILDGIRDPGNMGTIIRTADWFGINTIICSEDCVDCYNSKVVQATMGSLGVVNMVYQNPEKIILEHPDINVYATTLSGVNVFSIGKITEGLVILGNEGSGIRAELLLLANQNVTIPKIGKAESLNAAVACGIILSALL